MRICSVCNKNFIKINNFQKYCSKVCSKIARKEQKKIYDKIYHKKYYENHKDIYLDYRNKNKVHKKEYDKKYKITHKINRNIYEIKKRNEDISYKILCNLRSRIRLALKRNSKKGHTLEILGCSIDFLKQYLEKQFNKGMSWDNYGKWHIDHIKPCARFNFRKISEQKKCFNYTNLQPLWAIDNILKRDIFEA